MKKLFQYFIILFLFGCASTNKITYDYDEGADFDSFSTFVVCWDDLQVENTSHPNYDNDFIRESVANAIEEKMIGLGYTTNSLEPELQAGFKITIEKVETTFKNCDYNDELNYWQDCKINRELFTEETLVVYVSDFSKNQIIWQASTECNLNKSKKKIVVYIDDLVKTLFKKYPKAP